MTDRTVSRLVRVAACFGIYVFPDEDDTWHIVTPSGAELTLNRHDAAHRVLSELCEQTADWIAYRLEESPVKTFEKVPHDKWVQVIRLHGKRTRRKQRIKAAEPIFQFPAQQVSQDEDSPA